MVQPHLKPGLLLELRNFDPVDPAVAASRWEESAAATAGTLT